MAVWHAFLPFGLTIAICVFVSWQATENQNALRAGNNGAAAADDDENGGERRRQRRNGELLCDAPGALKPRQSSHARPPRTASELRARFSTLSKMPPGPRRLARGRALALAAENALREASPAPNDNDGGDGGNGENDENENGGENGENDEKEWQRVESRAAAAIRETLPWLDAKLAALAAEDEAAIKCGLCEICGAFVLFPLFSFLFYFIAPFLFFLSLSLSHALSFGGKKSINLAQKSTLSRPRRRLRDARVALR